MEFKVPHTAASGLNGPTQTLKFFETDSKLSIISSDIFTSKAPTPNLGLTSVFNTSLLDAYKNSNQNNFFMFDRTLETYVTSITESAPKKISRAYVLDALKADSERHPLKLNNLSDVSY